MEFGWLVRAALRYSRREMLGKYPYHALLSSETTAKGTGLEKSAGKEDPVELDSSQTL
jgi:hypothetical protein